MPGTIPTITDPSIVTTTTTSQIPAPLSTPIGSHAAPSAAPTAVPLSSPLVDDAFLDTSNSKASLSPTSLAASASGGGNSLSSGLPPAHPAAGVASPGAASLLTSGSAGSALAPTNQAAQLTAQITNMSGDARVKESKTLQEKGMEKAKQDKKSEMVQFIERDGHFSLVRNFHLADAFTLMNGFCGAQSLYASARYLLTSDPRHAWFALWFPLFGAIFDLLDGKVARWRQSSSMLGQELDSLADSLSFGAAPAFAAFCLGLRLPFDALVLTIFCCAGIARLARFNVTTAAIPHDASGKAKYFEGLPIPSSLILVGGMATCMLLGRIEPGALAIPLQPATASIFNLDDGKRYRFFARFAHLLPAASASTFGTVGKNTLANALKIGAASRVPLGTFQLNGAWLVAKVLDVTLVRTGVIGSKTLLEWSSYGVLEGHWLSLLWFAWAMAMVSKTLRVPKP